MLREYNNTSCKYNLTGFENVIYLVSNAHKKDIHIDNNGEAFIDELDDTPLAIECYNINLQEETSLDEKYEFHKTLTFTVNGYAERTIFGGRGYAIVELKGGAKRMVNVDFPSYISYEFVLDDNEYATTFTFETYSNFPTLRLDADFNPVERICLGYAAPKIDKLEMIERQNVALDRTNRLVTTNGIDFFEIVPSTISLREQHDGRYYIDTLTLTIPIDDYHSSWHYNLLEFKNNLYSAIVKPRSGENKIFVGFNTGLQPNYNINADDGTGTITVTLVEMSNHGGLALYDYVTEKKLENQWDNIPKYDDKPTYLCNGNGTAIYLLQKEVDGFGNGTGNYRAYSGWTEYFEEWGVNVVGEFSDIQEFVNASCRGSECVINTTIPTNINFTNTGCTNYSLKSTCDWEITDVPSFLTITPTSGLAEEQTAITICNTSTSNTEGSFTVNAGDTNMVVHATVTGDGFITPTSHTVDCLSHDVRFTYNASCPVTFSPSGGLYISYGNGQITVTVPRNETSSSRTFTITATSCNNVTTVLYIYQDKQYSEWRQVDGEYICDAGQKYEILTLFTGTTSTNMVMTTQKQKGNVIQGDTSCQTIQSRWVFDGYTCVDGNKYEVEKEQVSYDGGTTFSDSGERRLGTMIGPDATFCSSVEYRWVITSESICENDINN